MMNNKKKLIESVFSLGFVQVVILITGFVSLAYFSRVFDKDTLGRMVFLLSFNQLFVIFSDYGFNLSATKDVSINKTSREYVFNMWISVSLIKISIAIFAFFGYIIFFHVYNLQKFDLLDCLVAYTLVIGNVFASQWLYQGLGQLKIVSIVAVVIRLLFFCAIFIFVKDSNDFSVAVFLQSSPIFFIGLIILLFTIFKFKGCKIEKQNKSKNLKLIKNSWDSFVSVAAINIYTTSNVVFLGILTSPGIVANYNLSEKIVRAMQAIYIPIANAMYPHMSHEMLNDRKATLKFGNDFAIWAGSISFGLGCIVAYFSSFIIKNLFGSGYSDAEFYLKIIAFVPFVSILANIYGVLLMLPMGLEKSFSKILMLAAIFNIFLFYIMVSKYSGTGAAITNLIIELFIFSNFYRFVMKLNNNN